MLLPELNGSYPRHFIYGPVVFTVATRDLIRALGSKGLSFLAAMDSPLVARYLSKPEFDGEELVVFRLLTHRTTKGYDSSLFPVITHINDQPVKNLRDLVAKIRDCQDEFLTYTVAGNYETLVFQRSQMEEATEDVLSDEGIRYQYSKDLREVWEAEPTSNEANGVEEAELSEQSE